MKVEKEEIELLKDEIESSLEAVSSSLEPELEKAISLLEEEKSGEKLVYRIWKYGDKKQVSPHFRDFGYEDGQDLISSIRSMNVDSNKRSNKHELQGIKHALDRIYQEADS